MERNAFLYLTNLKTLNLHGNQISTIKEGTWYGLEMLQTLSLAQNEILTLKEGSWHGLEMLKILFLHQNRISIIERNTFMNLKYLKTLYLAALDNCTCNAVKELEVLQKRNVTVTYTCPQSFINGPINTMMIELACPGVWTDWYKTAECIDQDGQTIIPYRRKCKSKSGEDLKGKCIGPHTKTDKCNFNKKINSVTRSTTGKIKGKISFIGMKINGTKVTNNELDNVLSKKGTTYNELFEDSEKSLLFLHQNYNKNVTSVKIIRMTVGSLKIEYVITLKVHGDETLKDVKLPPLMNTTISFPNNSMFDAQGTGLLSISDYDECKESVNDCDKNAYCIIFPDSISYACQCKDAFVGNGFECESEGSDKKVEANDWVLITILSIIAVVFVALLMGMLIWYGKRRQRMKMAKKYMDAKGLTL